MPGEMPHVPMPLTDSASTPGRLPVLAEFSTLHRGELLKSLIDDHWHYIRQVQTGEEKLFDFRNDPLETRDLAPRPESQPILRDFRQQLARLFPADSLLNRRR